MALSVLWAGLVILSTGFGAASGRMDAVADAALSGAASAVEICVSMAGAVCLWSGVMEFMRQAGLIEILSNFLRPVLILLFPNAGQDSETMAALSGNFSANLLGLGNAATPLGIRAALRMARDSENHTASDELCRLVILNTASVQFIPATAAALRSAAGCRTPFDILPAVWITSILSVTAGLVADFIFRRVFK